MRRLSIVIVAAIVVAATSAERNPVLGSSQSVSSPQKFRPKAVNGVAGSYIIKLVEGAVPPHGSPGRLDGITAQLARLYRIDRVIGISAGKRPWFYVRMPEAAARSLSNDPRVEWVEQDSILRAGTVQSNAPWGLDRIDQRSGLNGEYVYASDNTGAGVRVYVMDSGIRTSHEAFGGRATFGADYAPGEDGNPPQPPAPPSLTDPGDCYDHGTGVADVIGGSWHGAAKGVSLISVRVINCQNQSLSGTSLS